MRDLSPVVFRGEPDGVLREHGSFLRPYFFAESYDQAASYGRGTDPIACVLKGRRFLDLATPDPFNPAHKEIAQRMEARFPEWECRYSGERRDIWSYLESADLYDYEGTGEAERWNALFQVAIEEMGFDAVRVMDCTDGTGGQPSPVWVTFHRENVRLASPGEKLAALIEHGSWAKVEDTIEAEHPYLLERVRRLRICDADYRLDRLDMPGTNVQNQLLPRVYRALPLGAEIRPGDWIALDEAYARSHLNAGERQSLKALELVHPQDIYWAGTDENEFFYLPGAWRIPAYSDEQYLRQLGPERVRILIDGEMAAISRHSDQLAGIEAHIASTFDEEACGVFHGPRHWERVSLHARAVARSLGIDPLVPHVFGLAHDSQREDEGIDPEHGARAAAFIEEHRESLFSFLRDEEVRQLANACDLHSHGVTEGSPIEMACWDGDRLDLWRVGITPNPAYLCTGYARRAHVIRGALQTLCAHEQFDEEDRFEWADDLADR